LKEFRIYYRRHLPHYQPEGETYHVVFRLAGSMPAGITKELRFRREQTDKQISKAGNERERSKLLRDYRLEHFERFEKLLAGNSRGPFWLRKPEIAEIVCGSIESLDEKEYTLIAYNIMPNHVHVVFELLRQLNGSAASGRDRVPSYKRTVCRVSDPTTGEQRLVPSYRVTDIVGSIKKYTALRANRVLIRRGAFWHDESYDHVIRGADELKRTIWYVLMNPVKAGLCTDWRDWKWSYVKEGYGGD
jgi:putative transposase